MTGTQPINLLRDLDQPFVFEVSLGRRQYRLEFYDTSSPENWRLLRPDLILICFDISHRPSLMNLQQFVRKHFLAPLIALFLLPGHSILTALQWIKEVRAAFQTESTLPLAVLGLKRDLRTEDDPNGALYPQEAYRVASEMRVDKYMECSAVTGELLQLAFEEICQMAVKSTTAEGGQSDGGCCMM